MNTQNTHPLYERSVIMAAAQDATSKYPATVAVIYEYGSTEPYDYTWGWQTGESMAGEGYIVVAVADDGGYDVARAQAMYDDRFDAYADCFGLDA